jgi:transposase
MKKSMKAVMIDRSARESVDMLESDAISMDTVASISPPDPEVAATAKRRQFSGSERRRILTAADRCTAPGEIGALLRREGIYSSLLASWRKKRAATGHSGSDSQKRGPKANPALAEARREEALLREIKGLRHQLAQAHTIIDVQKKLCTLLGLPTAEEPDGKS